MIKIVSEFEICYSEMKCCHTYVVIGDLSAVFNLVLVGCIGCFETVIY